METKQMKMTPELALKLKSFMGFTQNPEFCYIPKIFREEGIPNDIKPVFKLRGKNGLEAAKNEDNAGSFDMKTQRMFFNSGSQRIGLLRSNILGWKNFHDVDGNEIAFEKDGDLLSEKSVARITSTLQVELQEAINEQSRLTDEELQGLGF